MEGEESHERRGPGRPTLYTEAIADRIEQEVANGLPLEFAAPLAGVSYQTAYNWRNRGLEGEEKFVGFLERLQRAEAKAVAALWNEVRTADGGKEALPWTARAWCLERRWPKVYGRTVQEVEHTGTVQVLRVELPRMDEEDPEVRRQRMRDLAK